MLAPDASMRIILSALLVSYRPLALRFSHSENLGNCLIERARLVESALDLLLLWRTLSVESAAQAPGIRLFTTLLSQKKIGAPTSVRPRIVVKRSWTLD